MSISSNIDQIKELIKEHKVTKNVTFVAVTKTVGVSEIEEVLASGIKDIAENRLQVLSTKYETLGSNPDINWHYIGHLQTNKAKKVVSMVDYIHSVDSIKLAQVIDRHAAELNKKIKIFLEVNVSGEESKHGFTPEELLGLLGDLLNLKSVDIIGLMTMAPYMASEIELDSIFGELRLLKDKINDKNTGFNMKELSMGMSMDYIPALKQGATFVRIGSAIFK